MFLLFIPLLKKEKRKRRKCLHISKNQKKKSMHIVEGEKKGSG